MEDITIIKLRKLEKLVNEYRPMIRQRSNFYSNKAKILRVKLQNLYYELEEEIKKSLGGSPTANVFRNNYDIFDTAFSGANSTASFHTIKYVPELLRKSIIYFKKNKKKESAVVKKTTVASYVPKEIAGQIKKIKKKGFDVTKLTSLIEELNHNYSMQKPYATLSIIRAIMDHIPPLLGHRSYKTMANSHSWPSENDKKYALILARDKIISHSALHSHIDDKKDLISMNVIPSSLYLNSVLQECVMSAIVFNKTKKTIKKPSKKQEVSVAEVKNAPVVLANLQSASGGAGGYRLEVILQNIGEGIASLIKVSLAGKTVDLTNRQALAPKSDNVHKVIFRFEDIEERKQFPMVPKLMILYKDPVRKVEYETSYDLLLEERDDGLLNIAAFTNFEFEKATRRNKK